MVVAPEVAEQAANEVKPMTKAEFQKAVRKWQTASYELEVMTRQEKKLQGQLGAMESGNERQQALWQTAQQDRKELQVPPSKAPAAARPAPASHPCGARCPPLKPPDKSPPPHR